VLATEFTEWNGIPRNERRKTKNLLIPPNRPLRVVPLVPWYSVATVPAHDINN
jgi:hypothetical protein